MRCIPDLRRQYVERQPVGVRLDQRHGLGHRDPVAPDFIGLAAQAGAIARNARRGSVRKDVDILRPRVPRRAARLAIDTRRADRDDEAPVIGAVAPRKGGKGDVLFDRIAHKVDVGERRSGRIPRLAIKADTLPGENDTGRVLIYERSHERV